MGDPTWNTPAHLVGLPVTNWKKRTGFEMRGTLGECIERFLNLQPQHQQNCTLTHEAGQGNWGPASIRTFVLTNGPPPQMTANGRQLTGERLRKLCERENYDPSPHASHPAKDAHGRKPP
jgi:hypothetical protein